MRSEKNCGLGQEKRATIGVARANAVHPPNCSPLWSTRSAISEGPAYYVSHGGAAFPEVIAVLQGEGIKIDLAGETLISKKGIITSTFASVPDAPVTSFEMTFPRRTDSVLAAISDNVCEGALAMPTTITGQNGKVIEQDTTIKPTGCPARKKTTGEVKITKVEQKKLKANKKPSLTVKVAFKPASGKSSSAGVKVKLKS